MAYVRPVNTRPLSKQQKLHLLSEYAAYYRDAVAADDTAVNKKIGAPPSADREYARFVGAAIAVREDVRSRLKRGLSPRQLDRLLLAAVASRGTR